jgi:ABC-type glycerol-3-phosphate transport system permease component
MTTISDKPKGQKPPIFSLSRRRRLLKILAVSIMVVYSLVTLFPFYALFIRSFVPTKESTDLHLWIPETEDVNLDAEVGNLAVFYDLDLADFREALGIPATEFLMARTTLREVAEDYNIPEEEITAFFDGFYTNNGWNTILTGTLQSTTFWGALIKTLIVTIISLTLLILLSIMTGYGLKGLKRNYQMAVYNIYLLQMVIPIMLILLPQYLMFQWFFKLIPGYENVGNMRTAMQLGSLIMINIKGTALSIMIFTAAISAIPVEIEDSAKIDGASSWQYIRYILIPLLKVPIVSLIVIMLPLLYNQFLEAYVYLDPGNSTLLPFIQSTAGQFSTNYQVIYSAVLASVIPLVLVYLLFRKLFVEGAMSGAVKG